MKKVILLLTSLAFTSLFAHPASEVSAKYDSKTKLLTVAFDHQVRNENSHFIYEVVVKKNKKKIVSQFISRQETLKGGEFIYKIVDLKTGDKINVLTKCNKSGNKETELKIK